MWVKTLLPLLLNLSALAIELRPPANLPPPEQVEKKGIETKTGGKAPEVKTNQLPPPPPPPQGEPPPAPKEVIKPDIKELRRPSFEIKLGENLREKNREKQAQTQPQPQSQIQNSGSEVKEVKKEEVFERGYCRFLESYEVSIEPVFAQVECLMLTRPARFVRGEILLRPEVQSFALRGEVLSLGGVQVKSSRVLNSSRSSANVASHVDTRLISNILLQAGSKTGTEVSQMVQDIFRQPQTRLQGGVLVEERRVEESLKQIPRAALYSAIANLVSAGSEQVLAGRRSLPPLFKVYAGTEVYVEVQR